MINTAPQLTLIYGPMFSGKTTKLIELYNVSVSNYGQEKCIAFNYKLDGYRYIRMSYKEKIDKFPGLEYLF